MPKSSCIKWTYGRSFTYYRVASVFTRYIIAKGIIPKSLDSVGQFKHAEINEKDLTVSYGCTKGPGIDYRVVSLFTRYLTAIGIIPESLKLIGQFKHAEINEKELTVSYGRTDEQTDPKCRKTSFLISVEYM